MLGHFEFSGCRCAPSCIYALTFLKCTNNHHSCRACCNIYRWSQLFKKPVLLFAFISVYVFLTIVSQTSLCGLFSHRGLVLQPACMHSCSNTNKQKKGGQNHFFSFFFSMNAGQSGVTSISCSWQTLQTQLWTHFNHISSVSNKAASYIGRDLLPCPDVILQLGLFGKL